MKRMLLLLPKTQFLLKTIKNKWNRKTHAPQTKKVEANVQTEIILFIFNN